MMVELRLLGIATCRLSSLSLGLRLRNRHAVVHATRCYGQSAN